MKGPIFIAGIFTLAMSMGEFGASWVVTRFGQWDTLPVLIDQLRSRPGWDPLIQPTAAAAATVLMGITLVLFLIAERFRTTDQEGMF
jgi:ABC-type spermidine/putrescine transport system permease subunit II